MGAGLGGEGEMDEDDEPRDRELALELEWAGAEVGTRLYLVHACRCCLVTVETDREERAGTSSFIHHILSASHLPKHPHTHTCPLCLAVFFTYTHTHTHMDANSKVSVPH